ncbi:MULTISPECIES: hypothetical protein [Companilactobacillus]|uniref:Uncharacterized protein n=3 Tax=Companilactobacillus TaxID=2767879 RepID=A0ABR5NRA8_9LACO|nr:hypothetical protein [Companilactobacillus kimchii]KAE9561387.1 hypothetical protein ATN91_08100 [Companilactobacillus kimchii]KRK50291.1 hypothetical protein FC97_GL001736 [Companilactobacillus kimchii DSM 13961 = JCM 10707]OWF31842.1 hypothetical protein LKACC12383_02648 [Companilactobacillus kimchii]GEO48612.1 hypothetical protein LKI01_26110 [Companilactobacillus paralimentarius]
MDECKEKNLTRTYDMDDIDDLLCELDDSKIRINALMDYSLKIKRINDDQVNKNMVSHEYQRLSPIIELLNTEIFESIDKSIDILESNVKEQSK